MLQLSTTPQTKKQLLKNSFCLYKQSFWYTVPFVFLWIIFLLAGLFAFLGTIHFFNLGTITLVKTAASVEPVKHFLLLKPKWFFASLSLFLLVETYIWLLLPVYCYSLLNQKLQQQKISFLAPFKITFKKFFILLAGLVSYSFFIALAELVITAVIALFTWFPAYLLSLIFSKAGPHIVLFGHALFLLLSAVFVFVTLAYLFISFSFCFIDLLIGNAGPISVIKKTIRLVYKKWWHAFFMLFFAGLAYVSIAAILGPLHFFHLLPPLVMAILQAVLTYILIPWVLSVKLITYYDLKTRGH